ncbi:proteoglycan 3-like [Dendropsophus ebraccatus]|uniref:proteoglycan 3-like n=1 Tax=Dendropsophus ebraccatus TaxID=150705 RepID=UPI003831E8DD
MLSLLMLLLVGTTFAQESGDFAQESSGQLIKSDNNEDEKFDASFDDVYNEKENDEKDLPLSHVEPEFIEKPVDDVSPNKEGTTLYHFFPSPLPFSSAQRVCRSKGGSLTSIRNRKANTRLKRFVWRVSENTNFVWIGVWKRSKRSPYCNIDGRKLGYTNWASGRCRTDGQWCTAMHIHTGRWRSVSCGSRLPYICRY